MKRHIVVKISPYLPVGRGEKEGFSLHCPYNYGLISNLCNRLIIPSCACPPVGRVGRHVIKRAQSSLKKGLTFKKEFPIIYSL